MTMQVHHLNAATMCPAAAKLPGLMPAKLVCHVLVVEGPDSLTIVDTGLGSDDVRLGRTRLGSAFVLATGAKLDPTEPVTAQLPALGYGAEDVTDIVLTHLDPDHAGGLADFPKAKVHVHATELAAARHPSARERPRYVEAQWAHGPTWVEHRPGGDDWYGFASAQTVNEDIVMIPLHGHTRGHAGIAVRKPEGGWFLHAGDAYFNTGEKQTPRTCPPGLKAFQLLMQMDGKARAANQARIQDLQATHSDEITIFSAHDESELLDLR